MQLSSASSIQVRPSAGLLTRELLAPGAFVLAILISNYALAGLPNVKLFDLLVFVAGYSLGMRRGLLVAASAMFLYDMTNQWGPAQAPLLMTKVGAEMGYAVVGAVFARLGMMNALRLGPSKASVSFVVAALVTTVAYDLATNLYTAYFWASIAGGTDYMRWVVVTLFGPGALLYMVLHVGSNVALFPVFGPLLIKTAVRAKGLVGMRDDA
jgi:uncharacterized membrane protein